MTIVIEIEWRWLITSLVEFETAFRPHFGKVPRQWIQNEDDTITKGANYSTDLSGANKHGNATMFRGGN